MKKWSVLFFSTLAAILLFGCTADKENRVQDESKPQQQETLKDGKTLTEMVHQIAEELEVPTPGYIDINTINEVLGIKEDQVEDYAGIISMDPNSCDNFIVIHAKQDNGKKVKDVLEDRLGSIRLAYESILPAEYNKAKAGKVVQRGNFYFLIVVGREGKDPQEEVKEAEDIITVFFE